MSTVSVRTASTEDRPRVLEVVRRAFSGPDRDGAEELDIVTATWESGRRIAQLELVAVVDDVVVGHVLTAWGELGGRDAAGVAPVAVGPEYQGRGVGSAMMREAVERADRAGLPMLLLLGDPAFYGRFGFEAAAPHGIVYPPAGPQSPHFMVRRLSAYDPSVRGVFRYCWEPERS